ncbi:MAG: methylated-DNA--[protein]-cysteine S-methyltransferase [Candidatus Binatia bacterium]|nr:methylated-DNA--[protein]-cysteine S-methyltransferase [Candidatus Binatia bacterium]
MVAVASLDTPFGPLLLAASERGLCRLALPPATEHLRFHQWVQRRRLDLGGEAFLALAVREVQEYLAGDRRHFTVPLEIEGGEFFRRVWQALLGIPYGQTRTYAAVATAAGRPRAARAVGAACARNPIPLIIPCHRVVGQNEALTGFAGGLAMKEALLKLEGAR